MSETPMQPSLDPDRSMKGLLAVAVKEATRLALIDSCTAIEAKAGKDIAPGERLRCRTTVSPGPTWEAFLDSAGGMLDEEIVDAVTNGGVASGKMLRASGCISAMHATEAGHWTVELDTFDAILHHVPFDAVLMVERYLTNDERSAMAIDEYAGPDYVDFDPGALARNVAVRLLGPGGWQIGDLYLGNASPQEVIDHSVERPHRDPVGEIALGLQGIVGEMERGGDDA